MRDFGGKTGRKFQILGRKFAKKDERRKFCFSRVEALKRHPHLIYMRRLTKECDFLFFLLLINCYENSTHCNLSFLLYSKIFKCVGKHTASLGGFAANAAYLKNITAEHSCGRNKSELYYKISEATKLPFVRRISKCDQNDPLLAHPPKAIVDGNFSTFWQSEGSTDDARIRIDLTGLHQEFYYVKSITLYFGDYYRPGRIAFYKKSSESSNFEPWHYMVTERDNCQKKFGVPFQEKVAGTNSILCVEYEKPALETNENVTARFQGGRGVIVTNSGELNTPLLDWMNTTAVEIRFSGLRLFLDRLANRWQHYVVKEVEVSAYCDCNGQANGMECPYNSTIGDRQCVCQTGACGIKCDSCCAAYNQYPYKQGAKGPFILDQDAACEKCNCHDHSDVCIYNETVAKNNCSYDNNATNDECSMDIHGKYRGGGVCLNCKDNTEGINCQRCITGYYRKSGESQWIKEACQACKCYENGTKNTTKNGVLYLDCVRDDEEAARLINLDPGDCLCKNKTTGRRCDRCYDGYYNLTAENPEGCQACYCNTNGTVNGSITCNDDGICFCKQRVKGDKCSYCESGSFNLAYADQYGCTKCICSGITSNCSSSSMYKNKTNYDVKGWKLSRDLISNETLPVMNIQEDLNGQSIEMISANISTGQSLYWTADEEYFGGESLVGAYGGNLVFARKVSPVPNGTLEMSVQIILKGPRNITIKQYLPSLVSGSLSILWVKMVEFNWRHVGTNQTVNRSTFMLVLAKLHEIKITASYFTSGPGIYQTSFGNVQLRSVTNVPNGNELAVDVEQCSCSEAYTGLSCERCARGYHRVNVTGHTFFGVCVPCNCHGHTLDCDPDTGKCLDCQHNTTGFNCQLCKDGFYGEARNGTSDDCQKCPCEAPRTTTDLCSLLSNGSAQCLNCSQGYEKNLECNRCELGYFGRLDLQGGNCSTCQCNNNSDICDRETGSCLGYCANNATGWHCERCENGTYGDATKQQCQACTCNVIGSYEEPCNHTTGHCYCKPNVQGFNCSKCEVYSYGFNDTGCTQCDCNEFGSAMLQCNDSGICQCKNFTHGAKCHACDDEYYGLPNATCLECACNSTGSNSTICDHTSGQCPCKDGVEGRQCDRCKVQHKDFSSKGCEPCPRCTMKLQSRVDEARRTLENSEMKAEQADQSIDFYPELENIEGKLPGVQALQKSYTTSFEHLENYRQTFSNNTLNSTLINMRKREMKLTIEAVNLSSKINDELERNENISNLSKSALDYADSVKQKTEDIVSEMEQQENQTRYMNESSSDAVRLLKESISEALIQENREKNLSGVVKQNFKQAENAREIIKNQTEEADRLNERINQFNSEMNETRKLIEQGELIRNKTQDDIGNIKRLMGQVNGTIEKTKEILRQTSFYLNESTALTAAAVENYEKVQTDSLILLDREVDKLKSDVNDASDLLVNVSAVVRNASQHAQDLTDEARDLYNNFSVARRHGEKAVTSIERYDTITKKINNSVELSKQANIAVVELNGRISNLSRSNDDLNRKVLECQNKSSSLLAATLARNLDIFELDKNVSQADQTFTEANETCRRVTVSSSAFDAKSAQIITVAKLEEPLIQSYIRNSTNLASKTRSLSDLIKLESVDQKRRLTEANKTLSVVNSLVINASNLVQHTHSTVNKTELLLFNITQDVQESNRILQLNNQTQQNLTAKMAVLEAKLKSAKEKVLKFRLAMKLRGNTSVQLAPTKRIISNPLLSAISLDFKTNLSNGLLFYMSPSPNNSHQSVSLKLLINYVRFTYNLGSSPVVITNWEVPVARDTWYRVYATRYRDNARLTVMNLENGFFRTYDNPETTAKRRDFEMKFNENSPVFLGGLPTSQKVNLTERYFNGDLDNLVLNEERVFLWNPVAVEGVRRFTAKRAISANFQICVTFHGNGYIQQKAGTFETRTNSSLSFQFRSFFKDAVLVVVEGKEKESIYNVSLSDGRVIFQYHTITLSSANSYYNDGQWYDVHITRTLKNSSLLVTPLRPGTNKRNDYVTLNRALPLYLPSVEYIYFGGTNMTSNRFAGGMKLVFLSSMVWNRRLGRKLNDGNFTVRSEGVDFDECMAMVEEGLRYSNGYSALKTENIKQMTSLSIRFKTNEPSGLLAYSVEEEIWFYLALFHGNLFLVCANGTEGELPLIQTKTETLNDGAYHTVDIEISNSRVEMKVDTSPGETLSQDLPRHVPTPVPLKKFLFIGGTDSSVSIPSEAPVFSSFKGDIQSVKINLTTILDGSSLSAFESAISEHVSAAGVSPSATVLPTPAPTKPPKPPSCGDKYARKVRSETQEEVHFQGIDSVLSLQPNTSFLNTMGTSFVISLEFRALSPNGLLFLAMGNTSSQFVSLELVSGNLIYQFNTGRGLLKMTTKANYAIGGVWYTVNLLRIGEFGAIVIPESKEYHRDLRNGPGARMVINSIFVGGKIDALNTSMLQNVSAPSFFGCIRKLSIQTVSHTKHFNLSGEAIMNQTRNVQPGQCYDFVQSQVGFNGSGYAELSGIYNFSAGSELNIRFRTTERNGLLFVAMDKNGSNRMELEQVNGQIVLSYVSSTNRTTLAWPDPVNDSYALCQNIYHDINVKQSLGLVELQVNSWTGVKINLTESEVFGTVYVGGIPSDLGVNVGSTGQTLVGCVESVLINGHMVDFRHELAKEKHVEFGCRGPIEPRKTYSDFNPLQVFTLL